MTARAYAVAQPTTPLSLAAASALVSGLEPVPVSRSKNLVKSIMKKNVSP